MKYYIFPYPFWLRQIDISKVKFNCKLYEDHFLSKTKSSFNGTVTENNKLDPKSVKYLLNIFKSFLEGFEIEKIILSNIWRNLYDKNGFQDVHFHAGCHFCFIIYEKLNKPQTVFVNPAYDLLREKNLDKFITPTFTPTVKQNDMVFFPSFLKHYVTDANDSITISGNINIL